MSELSFCGKLDYYFASIVLDSNQSHNLNCLQSTCDIVSDDWKMEGKCY